MLQRAGIDRLADERALVDNDVFFNILRSSMS
jgi:hypothetical protein